MRYERTSKENKLFNGKLNSIRKGKKIWKAVNKIRNVRKLRR